MESQRGHSLNQKPVVGQDALLPPDAETARRYLAEATAVAERRDSAIDRRGIARLQIVNAVITAAFLLVFAYLLRGTESSSYQVVLFAFLLWGLLAAGIAQRDGIQWRMTRTRLPLALAGAVVVVVAFVVFGLVIFVPDLPTGLGVVPAALFLLAFGGHGVVQLRRAATDPLRAPARREPLPRAARAGTVGVGIVIGALHMLARAPEGVLSSVLILLIALLVVAWMFVGATDAGLPAIGARWRWPHLAGFGAAAAALLALVLLQPAGDTSMATAGLVTGGAVIVLFAVLAVVPGRASRD